MVRRKYKSYQYLGIKVKMFWEGRFVISYDKSTGFENFAALVKNISINLKRIFISSTTYLPRF